MMELNTVYTHRNFLDVCFVCIEDQGGGWYTVLWFLQRNIEQTGNWRYTIPLTHAESLLISDKKSFEFQVLSA